MPMKICDIPSALPVPSATPTRISLNPGRQDRRAGEGEDGARHAPAFAFAVLFLFISFDARERATVRLEGEQQVKCIRQQQHAGDSEIGSCSCRVVPSGAK